MTKTVTYAETLIETLEEVLLADDRSYLVGGNFLGLTPKRDLFWNLYDKYPGRILVTPTSELGFCGFAIGAAMAGLRPIVDTITSSFIFNAWPQVINEASNAYYMSGGQTRVPVIFHFLHGLRGSGGPQHSHSPQGMFWNTPGLEIMLPSSPRDLQGLLRTASRRDNPVIFVDHARLFPLSGPVQDKGFSIPFGQADVKREGEQVTVVATSLMVQRALSAAEKVKDSISVEVVDPRTLVPLDKKTILGSVEKTGRLVVADEGHLSCGVAAELSAIVADEGFSSLKAPIMRVATPDVPVPFSKTLEEFITPTEERIIASVRSVAGR